MMDVEREFRLALDDAKTVRVVFEDALGESFSVVLRGKSLVRLRQHYDEVMALVKAQPETR